MRFRSPCRLDIAAITVQQDMRAAQRFQSHHVPTHLID